ncbi:hypothetical protein HHK36_027869 [Tetracentron sinense]|uniref:Cytochrome P450 n=1 Tax=Tetracentron sinense TaxID=13715 RepID=A0A834YFK0_TETSI|nr:hypothetical protein HHK36_027869 [Tetracentron sinense]
MEFFSYIFLSFFLGISFHGLLYYTVQISRRRKLPPGPVGLPVVGSLFQIGKRPHESLTELAKTHGPLMTLQLGFVTTIVASSADMAKEILQKNDQAFSGRTVPDSVTGETDYQVSVVWIPTESRWRNIRRLCNTQIFTSQKLDALQGLRHQMMEEMVSYVKDVAGAGEAVNIGKLAFANSLNLLSNTIFSVHLADYKSETVQEFKDAVGSIMENDGKPNIADFFPWLKPFDPQGIRSHAKVAYDRIHALCNGFIDRRLQSIESGLPRSGDFLDALLDYSHENGSDFNRQVIKVLLTDLFVGGTDTSSTTIEWAMTELLRHPSIMAKARRELAEKLGDRQKVEESDIPRLPYLQAVVKETMRLHPTVPLLLPHRAETDVELLGFHVPKHTQVLVNTWAIFRDPNLWEKPTCFIPERFLESEVDFRGRDFSYIPFSAGRRICPGLPLAVRMVNLVLASLVHRFEWKLPEGMSPEKMDISDKFGVTLQKAVPLLAIPIVGDGNISLT